jgi:hypothetical protein
MAMPLQSLGERGERYRYSQRDEKWLRKWIKET